MKWVCLFVPCKWVHIANCEDCGIWQCLRCKTVSRGRKLLVEQEEKG